MKRLVCIYLEEREQKYIEIGIKVDGLWVGQVIWAHSCLVLKVKYWISWDLGLDIFIKFEFYLKTFVIFKVFEPQLGYTEF